MIMHDDVPFPSPRWDKVSQEAKDFICALLQKRPSDRLSAETAKSHPWIKKASSVHSGVDAAHELGDHEEIFTALEGYCHADGLAKLSLQVIAFSTPPAKLEQLRHLFFHGHLAQQIRNSGRNWRSRISVSLTAGRSC